MNRSGLIVKNNSHFNLLDWLYMDDAAAEIFSFRAKRPNHAFRKTRKSDSPKTAP